MLAEGSFVCEPEPHRVGVAQMPRAVHGAQQLVRCRLRGGRGHGTDKHGDREAERPVHEGGVHGIETGAFYLGVDDEVVDEVADRLFRPCSGIGFERHYTTKKHSPEFLRAFRALMADTVGDADEAQRLLKKQLDSQLAALDVQEENLLDLAADGTVASAKIKARLRKIGQERERLVTQRDAVTVDLTAGARFLDAQLSLLENPHELYKDTTDEVRRRLNQAVFGAIYITDEDVIGSRLTAPHGELFAAEAAYQAATLGLDQDAIRRHFAAAFALGQGTIPTKDKETAPKGGLFADYSTVATTAWSSLFTGSAAGAVSSKPPMVELGGIEPPSNAEILRLLRAQSVETFCSAPTFVTDT